MTTKMLAKNKSLIKKDGELKPKKKGNNQYALYSGIITTGRRKTVFPQSASCVTMRKRLNVNELPESKTQSSAKQLK